MARRWTPTEDVAVRLAAALDWEHGGHRLVDLAERLGRTESAVRQRASRLRALQLDEDVDAVDGPSVMILAGGLAIVIFVGRGHFCPVRATSPQ